MIIIDFSGRVSDDSVDSGQMLTQSVDVRLDLATGDILFKDRLRAFKYIMNGPAAAPFDFTEVKLIRVK